MADRVNTETEVLAFIKRCVGQRKIFWTYHVNMRMRDRLITREMVIQSVDCYEIIEENPSDKYLPSYLVYSQFEDVHIHVLFAIDKDEDNVRIITAYRPNEKEWMEDMKTRRSAP